jgi:hypothetical protein
MIPLELLPQPDFTWVICGPTKSGKTYMFTDVLKTWINTGVFKSKNIHLFCPTSFQDLYKEFPEIKKYNVSQQNIIEKIKEQAKYVLEKYGRANVPNILIIYDDCFASDKNIMRSNIAADLTTHGRHYNINQVLLSQQINGVAKSIRINAAYTSLFRPSAMLEAEDFLTQLVDRGQRGVIWEASKRCWAEPYGFVHICAREEKKFRCGFERTLVDNLPLLEYESSDSSE